MGESLWQKMIDKITTFFVKTKLTSVGSNFRARNPGLIFLGEGSEVHVGSNVLFERHVRISTGTDARIYIGDNTYLGDHSNVLAVKEVRIGNNCSISWHVLFMDTSSHPIGVKGEEPKTIIEPIIVEDNVWVGSRAVILKGVRIGKGAVIANNSVVSKDVPPHTLVGGIPAKVLKENVVWGSNWADE